MLGDRLRRPHRRQHRHAAVEGDHVFGDVAAEHDVYAFFEGDIRILRKISSQVVRRLTSISE